MPRHDQVMQLARSLYMFSKISMVGTFFSNSELSPAADCLSSPARLATFWAGKRQWALHNQFHITFEIFCYRRSLSRSRFFVSLSFCHQLFFFRWHLFYQSSLPSICAQHYFSSLGVSRIDFFHYQLTSLNIVFFSIGCIFPSAKASWFSLLIEHFKPI